MKERPIPFGAPMVRAILDGRKTMTRRVVKPVRGYTEFNTCQPDLAAASHEVWWHGDYETVGTMQACPYGQPGDRLWVKEAWKTNSVFNCNPPRELPAVSRVFYLADTGYSPDQARYRHARFMPRWASRITLEVTGVRVERLHDISYKDALAEGISDMAAFIEAAEPGKLSLAGETAEQIARRLEWPQRYFRQLWESINGAVSWDANPWVWVIEFTRVELAGAA